MLIDWFTVAAQVLNFLILVGLLKHFLYKPILTAIDTREKRIAAELAAADAKKAEAQKEHEEFQHQNEDFDRQRAALMAKATDQANAERQRLLDEARKAADELVAKRQETLRNDAQRLSQDIGRRTQREVFDVARKALSDLATVSLEERLGEVFTRRLRELDPQAKEILAAALKTASGPTVVRSAFDLPDGQKAAIQNALNETFAAEIHVRFETAPDLVSGIELTANGQKVGWTIAHYLSSMEKDGGELLKAQEKPVVKPVPKPEPKPEVKTTAPADPKPAVKAEPAPAAALAPKLAATAEPAPAPKMETKPEVKTVAPAEPKPEAEPKPTTKAEPAHAAKAEPVAEAKIEPKPEVAVEAPKPAATAP